MRVGGVIDGHRLICHCQVQAVSGDEFIHDVKLRLVLAIHEHNPAIVDVQAGRRIVGRVERDQAQVWIDCGKAIQIDRLLVHEPVAANGHQDCRAISKTAAAAAAMAASCSADPPETPTPATTLSWSHSGSPPANAMYRP